MTDSSSRPWVSHRPQCRMCDRLRRPRGNACSAEAFPAAFLEEQQGFRDSAEAVWLRMVGCRPRTGPGAARQCLPEQGRVVAKAYLGWLHHCYRESIRAPIP